MKPFSENTNKTEYKYILNTSNDNFDSSITNDDENYDINSLNKYSLINKIIKPKFYSPLSNIKNKYHDKDLMSCCSYSYYTDFSVDTLLQPDEYSSYKSNIYSSQYYIYNNSEIYGINNSTLIKSKVLPRSRTFYDPEKLVLLEKAFNENPYASKITRINIASQLNITENQVKVWFQNRRSKVKNNKKLKDRTRSLSNDENQKIQNSYN